MQIMIVGDHFAIMKYGEFQIYHSRQLFKSYENWRECAIADGLVGRGLVEECRLVLDELPEEFRPLSDELKILKEALFEFVDCLSDDSKESVFLWFNRDLHGPLRDLVEEFIRQKAINVS